MAHDCDRREEHKDIFVVLEKVLVPVVPGRFTHIDAEAASGYHRRSPESAAPSQ